MIFALSKKGSLCFTFNATPYNTQVQALNILNLIQHNMKRGYPPSAHPLIEAYHSPAS